MTWVPTPADLVWNRAALGGVVQDGERLKRGDEMLRSLLIAHGLIMNSGVVQCVTSTLNRDQVHAAVKGYRYLGLDEAADVLLQAADIEDPLDEAHDHFDADYWAAIPDDETIAARFEDRYRTHPDEFDPPGR